MITTVFAVVAGMTAAVLTPVAGFSWPWDDDREIRVTGQVQCNGFDVANDYAFQEVEGFEIRGRSNVRRDPTGTGMAVEYDVSVPPGWVVEYSVKCSGNPTWLDGSFEVTKTVVGSSYKQERHVCVDSAISFAPCISRDYGYCIDLWIAGRWKPTTITDGVFRALYKAKSSTLESAEGCAQALQDSLPVLSSTPAPSEPPSVAPLPEPTHSPETPLPTVPVAPTDAGNPTPTEQPTVQPTQVVNPTPTPTPTPPPGSASVVIDNRVTNGMGMVEDPNSPAYLSTVTQNRCRVNGCMLPGTEMSSGATLTVTCQITDGARTTNGNDLDPPADDANPERFESTRWHLGVWGDGRAGWISEVWIRADGRGGLGLRAC